MESGVQWIRDVLIHYNLADVAFRTQPYPSSDCDRKLYISVTLRTVYEFFGYITTNPESTACITRYLHIPK